MTLLHSKTGKPRTRFDSSYGSLSVSKQSSCDCFSGGCNSKCQSHYRWIGSHLRFAGCDLAQDKKKKEKQAGIQENWRHLMLTLLHVTALSRI